MVRTTHSAAASSLHNSSEFSGRSALRAANPSSATRHLKAPRTRRRLAMHICSELHLVSQTLRIANELP